MAEPENGSSPLAEALARVGDPWTLLVVEALLGGPQRFNDLLGQIPGIAASILSEPRDAGALCLLAHWGARHADPAEAPRHPACGTLLQARWYCPTCNHLVDHEPRDAGVSYL